MPKIPTFVSQARPTAEVSSVKSNLQVPLSQTVAGALEPLTNALVKQSIQENDINNKTQALRLENDYNTAMQDVTTEIVTNPKLATNQELSQQYLLEQSEINRTKYASQADNKFTKTSFINNSLLLDQKYSNKLRKDVSNSILVEADIQYGLAKNRILTDAILPDNADFNRKVLRQDLENLIQTSFLGKVDAATYNQLINDIPNEVYGFEITKGLSSNPKETFTKLLDSESYPDLNFKLREKFKEKAKLILTNPLKNELNNAIFGLQFQGRAEEVDLPFTKSVLTTEDFNEFSTRYGLAKQNASDVRTINSLPSAEVNDFISNKKYTENAYAGTADIMTQQVLLTGLQKAATNRNKLMLSDPVGFINSTDPEIKVLYDNFLNSGNSQEDLIQNRQIYNTAVVAEQIKRSGKNAVLKVLTKKEINTIKEKLSSNSIKAEEKIASVQALQTIHGTENMVMIARQLQAEGVSEQILTAISTNSKPLASDLFSSSSAKDLIELTKINEAEASTILSLIGDATEDYQSVISSQGEGSVSSVEHNLQINKAIYKSVLLRITRGETIEDAVESASKDFLNDYTVSDEKTMLTPIDVMGVPVPLQASDIKRQGIIDMIKFTDVLDRFMGEDGYAHLATMTNGENLTEEEIREKILFTARNYPRWINNGDVTGAVLQYELSGSNRDIVNSKGQRIEYYFTDQPNQNPEIKATEFTFPYLNETLPVAEDVDTVGEIDYDPNLEQTFSSQNPTLDKVSKVVIDNISNVFSMGSANAGQPELGDKFLADSSNIKMLTDDEGFRIKPYFLEYKDLNGKMVNETFRTVGNGHKITEAEEKSGKIHGFNIDTLTKEELKIIFKKDLKEVIKNVDNLVTNKNINPTAYSILVQMGFQLGNTGLSKFEKTIKAINELEYDLASKHMLNNYEDKDYKNISKEIGKTKWHIQTKTRAKKLSKLMASLEKKSQLTNESP